MTGPRKLSLLTDAGQHGEVLGQVDVVRDVGGVGDGLEGLDDVARGRVERHVKLVGD